MSVSACADLLLQQRSQKWLSVEAALSIATTTRKQGRVPHVILFLTNALHYIVLIMFILEPHFSDIGDPAQVAESGKSISRSNPQSTSTRRNGVLAATGALLPDIF